MAKRFSPKLIIHYLPEPRTHQTRTYCGAEDRTGSIPATSSDIATVDCLSCLRAHQAMWGKPAADRIAEVKRARARTAELLGLGKAGREEREQAAIRAEQQDICPECRHDGSVPHAIGCSLGAFPVVEVRRG